NPFKDLLGKDGPKKGPPPNDGPLATSLIGTWEDTGPILKGQKVEFTADGRFIQFHLAGPITRNYRVVGSTVEIDLTAEERTTLTELRKTLPQIKIPARWRLEATATATEMSLEFKGDALIAAAVPGGPIRQTYKRTEAVVIDPKTVPAKDDPQIAAMLVGVW